MILLKNKDKEAIKKAYLAGFKAGRENEQK